ncbi:MAG: hypothetical protein LCH85_06340 [Chloroflexi bacterium]|nr:hypothetical protein [Chloroflexota bacterium]
MSEEPPHVNPLSTKPELPNSNSAQGYHIPSTVMADHNQPSRWVDWLIMNGVAFVISCIVFPILFIGCLLLLAGFTESASATQAQISDGFSLLFVVGIPAFVTMYLASFLQWTTVSEGINRSTWVTNSATVGAIALTVWIYHLSPITAQSIKNYNQVIFLTFGITSSSVSWAQWLELRKTIDQAWQWALISIITWTGLGTLIFGFGLSYLVRR